MNARMLLITIIAIYLVVGTLYAIETPPWQTPDEPAHYNYIAYLVEKETLPVLQPGDWDQEYFDLIKSLKFPPEMSIVPFRYEFHQPPLYYALAAPVYALAREQSMAAQVVLLRLFSVALGAILLLAIYRIVGEIFPQEPLLALMATGFVAALPQHVAMSAAINNDTLAELALAAITLLALRAMRSGLTRYRTLALGILLGLALLTKTTIYFPAIVAILAGIWWTRTTPPLAPPLFRGGGEKITGGGTPPRPPGRGGPLHPLSRPEVGEEKIRAGREQLAVPRRGAPLPGPEGWEEKIRGRGEQLATRRRGAPLHPLWVIGAIALAISGWWFVRNALVYGVPDFFGWGRHDSIVVGQLTTAEAINRFGQSWLVDRFLAFTFQSFWAQFGWLGVLIDARLYQMLSWFTLVILAGVAIFALRMLRTSIGLHSFQKRALATLTVILILVGGSYVAYNLRFVQHQGRYLFPAIPSLALLFALGLAEWTYIGARFLARLPLNPYPEFWRSRAEAIALAAVYVGLVALDLISLYGFIIPQLRR